MYTRTPSFRVIANEKGGDIPVSVAGRIMIDIQSIIIHIGSQMIEKELMTMYGVPKEYLNRFVLHITEVNGRSMTLSTETQDRFTGSMMDDAVGILTCILDSEEGVLPKLIVDMFPNPEYRSWIIQDLDALSRDMTGYSISYNSGGTSGTFKGTSEETIPRWMCPLPEDHPGTAVGLLYKDPLGRLLLTCDKGDVNLDLNGDSIEETDSYDSIPYAATGHLVFTRKGILSEVRKVKDLSSMESINVSRIISRDSDIKLESPIKAMISYAPDSKTWILSNDGLSISVVDHIWENAVRAFHDALAKRMDDYNADRTDDRYCELIRMYSPAYRN